MALSSNARFQLANQLSLHTAQVLGIILTLSVSGSVFTNRAVEKIATALPSIPADEVAALITGASGHLYKSLSEGDRALVVVQITDAISEAFYYLVCITALGFISSLFLSVRVSHFSTCDPYIS